MIYVNNTSDFLEQNQGFPPELQNGFKKILLVANDLSTQFLYQKLLFPMNCRLTLANDATESFWFLERLYDLILLDIALPGMDGIQLAQTIRSGDTINKHTDIFVLTDPGEQRIIKKFFQ